MMLINPNNKPDLKHTIIDVFLAGGISNCPDWQTDMLNMLETIDKDLKIANPRRDIDISQKGTKAKQQIAWEFNALHKAKQIIFWFPKETIAPITLFELGAHLGRLEIPLIIGAHPEYTRRFDVEQQVQLVRPGQKIFTDLEDISKEFLKLTRDSK